MSGWFSKSCNRFGNAHYVTESGATACAARPGPHGIAMGALLKTGWVPLREQNHLCGWCRKVHPKKCECSKCRVIPSRR